MSKCHMLALKVFRVMETVHFTFHAINFCHSKQKSYCVGKILQGNPRACTAQHKAAAAAAAL